MPALPVPDRLRPWLPPGFPPWRRVPAIAFFGYSTSGYAGETNSQEDIFEVSPTTGAVRRITDDRGAAFKSDRDPAWGPDRSTLAIHTATDGAPGERIALISRSSGAELDSYGPGFTPRWLGAGALLCLRSVLGPDGEPHIQVGCIDLHTRVVTPVTDIEPGVEIVGYAWHATGGLALALSDVAGDAEPIGVAPAAAVAAARAPGGTPLPRSAFTTVTPAGVRAGMPRWSPTGDRIALTTWVPGAPSRVGLLSVATGTVSALPAPSDPTLSDSGPVFSPDGATVAFLRGYEDAWSEIWLWSRTLGKLRLRRLTDDSQGRFKGSLDW